MSIKNFVGMVMVLTLSANLSAQKDTTYQTIRQENGAYIAPVIETPADRLFRTKMPGKWMFKMNLGQSIFDNKNQIAYRNANDGMPLVIGAEYKLSSAFSLGAYYSLRLGFQVANDFNKGGWLFDPSLSVEGRWYHDMNKRIKAGRSANNFGGKYLALEASILNTNSVTGAWGDRRIALRYGLQQRFMRRGYFDISIGAGITDESYILKRPKVFSTDQRVAVGLAAFLPKTKSVGQNGGLCDVLHCQDEQRNMLKINLLNAINFRSEGNIYNIGVRPNIAFEHKIGHSPFSVELDLDAAYSNTKLQYYDEPIPNPYAVRFTSANWNATGELRWYYNMRKRILEGKSGNNLSGTFIGLQLNRNNLIKPLVSIKSEATNNIFDNSVIQGDYWTSNLVWGIQQRLFDSGFIQFKVGVGSTFGGTNYRYQGANKPMPKIERQNELNILADLKVGFAF